MMNRSIVMTSDPFTLPIRGESDGAAPIGPEHRDAVSREPLEHLGRRMAVVVVPTNADYRFGRPRLEHKLRIERLDDGRQPAQMIAIAMGRNNHRAPPHTLATQEGDHNLPPGITVRGAGAAIDHEPPIVWGA